MIHMNITQSAQQFALSDMQLLAWTYHQPAQLRVVLMMCRAEGSWLTYTRIFSSREAIEKKIYSTNQSENRDMAFPICFSRCIGSCGRRQTFAITWRLNHGIFDNSHFQYPILFCYTFQIFRLMGGSSWFETGGSIAICKREIYDIP